MKPGLSIPVLVLALGLPGASIGAAAADSDPYFASLKSDQVFMREGPSEKNRIKWIYRRKGLPVEVLSSFDVWRRVRDMDGETGWVHVALLSRDRTVVIEGKADADVRRGEQESSSLVAEAKPGAIGRLLSCGKAACQVKFDAVSGWIERAHLWGVRDGNPY
jgi:SH3-like domain-containing protein